MFIAIAEISCLFKIFMYTKSISLFYGYPIVVASYFILKIQIRQPVTLIFCQKKNSN